jgi:hypothetical protein
MALMARTNTATNILFLTALINGLTKLQPNSSFTIAGVTYTTATLVTIFQRIIAALSGVSTAKAAWRKASQSSHALQSQYGVLVEGMKHVLLVEASNDPTILEAYGLTPPKPKGPRSPKAKVAAADKAAATREARHTMGPKAKLAITGATAPATAAEPAAPAGTTASSAPPSATPVVTPGH